MRLVGGKSTADFPQKLYYAHHVGGNPHARDAYRDHPWFDDCATFCERWDQNSFDPDYPHESIDFFRPMVEQVFARKAYDPAIIRAGERVALTDPTVARERNA